ncbi:hypothetical protein BKA83DRAFT_4122789 [Pisolithus microcarpus]|nr:hypothetical protein BKA83DRAFT_4122789 [Pisolithus microcarpus]
MTKGIDTLRRAEWRKSLLGSKEANITHNVMIFHRAMFRFFVLANDNDVSGIHGSAVVDLPRAGHSTSLGSSGPRRQLQPIAGNYHYSLPSHTPSDATSVLEEAQGNSLYDRMDDFHFSPQLSERRALVTASFDIACSKTAHNAHPVGDASSFRNPSAGEYPAAAYPTFIPGHEHVGPSDQAWRGGARTQEVVHSTSTLSGITSDLPYGFDDCHVYTDDGASSSYDPSSFAGGFMQTSPPMRRTGQSTTSPSRRPQAPTRSAYDVDVHTLSRKSDCGYDTSHLSGTMATAVESDAVYDHGVHIQASRLVGDRDRQSGQSQAPSFAHCQYQSQPPHLSQHLPPRNSSDLSYAYIPAPSSQPLRSDADYSPVPNPGSESQSSPVSAPGRSVTGLTTCSSATHLQPHSAPPMLHERSCSPLGDSHSPAPLTVIRRGEASVPSHPPLVFCCFICAVIADHLQHFHGFKGGETTTRCLWRDCPKPNMKGTSIARHVVTHVGFRIRCDTCKHEFARGDARNRAHIRSHCTGVAQPMYGNLQRVLDARKVDSSRRLTKKRRLEEL